MTALFLIGPKRAPGIRLVVALRSYQDGSSLARVYRPRSGKTSLYAPYTRDDGTIRWRHRFTEG